MNLQGNRGGGDDVSALIEAASGLVAGLKSGVPESFIAKLFAGAAAEDLQDCGAAELASIAERSWSFFAERRPQAPKIRFEPLPERRGISMLEIVNDDMPFLVDSIVSELNSRGNEIRLLVHPVFLVSRDATGHLVGFDEHAAGARRESFIHFHIEGADDAAQRADIVLALQGVLAEVRISVQDWQL